MSRASAFAFAPARTGWSLALCLVACAGEPAASSAPGTGAELGKSQALSASQGEPVAHGPSADGKPPIYVEQADDEAALTRALDQARRENKRVLVVFGGNWCGWCHALHALFEAAGPVHERLARSYVQLRVDSRTGKALAKKVGAQLPSVPFLTVLDAEGKPLVHQETGSLELSRGKYPDAAGLYHDAAKVSAFLERYAPPAG